MPIATTPGGKSLGAWRRRGAAGGPTPGSTTPPAAAMRAADATAAANPPAGTTPPAARPTTPAPPAASPARAGAGRLLRHRPPLRGAPRRGRIHRPHGEDNGAGVLRRPEEARGRGGPQA